jgi:hypothetical protein
MFEGLKDFMRGKRRARERAESRLVEELNAIKVAPQADLPENEREAHQNIYMKRMIEAEIPSTSYEGRMAAASYFASVGILDEAITKLSQLSSFHATGEDRWKTPIFLRKAIELVKMTPNLPEDRKRSIYEAMATYIQTEEGKLAAAKFWEDHGYLEDAEHFYFIGGDKEKALKIHQRITEQKSK